MNNSELKTRKIAWNIIKTSIIKNYRLSDVIAEVLKKENNLLKDTEKRFITMLVKGTVRMSGRLDWEIKQVFIGEYADLKENMKILLRLGVFQLFFMDSIPNYAAVATTVQLAKKVHKNLGGLANAILRTIIKKENKFKMLDSTPISTIAEYYSHPEWLMKKWMKDFSRKDALEIAEWNNKNPKIWFRVNKINYSAKLFIEYLKNNNIEYNQFEDLPEYISTSKNQDILKSKLFREGKISVQDPSAGLAVQLLNPLEEEMIVDACAAPGGKSLYIAELLKNKGQIFSYDIDSKRLNKLNESIKRLNIDNINISKKDITKDKIQPASKMLLDVPCSGTGVISKKVDIKWRRTVDEILEMHLLQRKILWNAAKYIEPNGILVYSTCSIELEENYMVLDAFLKSHSNFKIEPADKFIPSKFVDERGAMFLFPPLHSIDGGFAVRLRHSV